MRRPKAVEDEVPVEEKILQFRLTFRVVEEQLRVSNFFQTARMIKMLTKIEDC